MASDVRDMGLMDFVEHASSGRMQRPVHLAPMVDMLARARRLEDVRGVVAAPVQHGKTSRERTCNVHGSRARA